jgi:hypothetical protein
VIGNIVRRVLHMIREEDQAGGDEDAGSAANTQAAEEHQVAQGPGGRHARRNGATPACKGGGSKNVQGQRNMARVVRGEEGQW